MLDRTKFSNLSENEFKLLSNLVARKNTKSGITEKELPFDGDGYTSMQDRNQGYRNLKKLGYIFFEDATLLKNQRLNESDIRLLIKNLL